MPVIANPLREAAERALSFEARREDVIAANVANASTPGYRAFDLVLADRLGDSAPLAPRATNALHLLQDDTLTASGGRLVRSDAPARLDGNNVSLDQEMLRMLENRMRYTAGLELLDRWTGLGAIAREVR